MTKLLQKLKTRRRQRKVILELEAMTDRELHDMGIHRANIPQIVKAVEGKDA